MMTVDPADKLLDAFYADAGLTEQRYRDLCDESDPHSATFTASYYEEPDGRIIPGVVVQIDREGNQEFGLPKLRSAFCGADHRNFQMRQEAVDRVAVFTDRPGLVLSRDPLAAGELRFGDPIRTATDVRWGSEGLTGYAERHARDRRWTSRLAQLIPDPAFTTVAKLREQARSLEISPLPRSKQALCDAIAAHPDMLAQAEDLWPLQFDRGEIMVLAADAGTATGAALARISEAARNGRLVFGQASGPFHHGLFLTDAAFETRALIDWRSEQFDWHDAEMAELGDRERQLKDAGVSVHFLGNPRAGGWNDEDSRTRYWLNADGPRQGYGRDARSFRLAGWWTLTQLDRLIADVDWPRRWWDEQLASFDEQRRALEAQGLTLKVEPEDRKPADEADQQRYRFSVLRGETYLISEVRITREQIEHAAAHTDEAIAAFDAAKQQRNAESARRRAERDREVAERRARLAAA